MTESELQKYQIVEQELSEKLAEKIGNVLEGFCREHNCKVQQVVFYAPSGIGQPAVVAGVQFSCVANERLEQLDRERNPKVIVPNGVPKKSLVN